MKRRTSLTMVTIASVALISACGGNAGADVSNAPNETIDETTTAPETSEATAEASTEAPTEAPSYAAIGETASLKDWNITVTNMQILDSIDAGDYFNFSPDEGNKYLVVTANIENTGKAAGTFLPTIGMNDDVSAKVLYSDGYEFSKTQLLGYDRELADSHINPLSSKEGDITFEIPNSVAESSESLLIEFDADNDSVVFSLR